MERLRASTQAVFGSVERGNVVFERFVELARLPGVTIAGAARLANTFEGIGLQAQLATGYIEELGNAVTLTGGTSVEFGRVRRGMEQILSIGRVLQEEINQLTESSILVGNALENAFGSRRAEDIRRVLSAAGPGLNESEQIRQIFAPRLLEGLRELPRAPTNTLNESVRRLNVSFQEFAESFTSTLLPAITQFTRFAGGTLDVITSINDGTSGLLANTLLLSGGFSLASAGFTVFSNITRDLLPDLTSVNNQIQSLSQNIRTDSFIGVEGSRAREEATRRLDALRIEQDNLQTLQQRQRDLGPLVRNVGSAILVGAIAGSITTVVNRFIEYNDALEQAEDATRRFFTTSNNLTQQDQFISGIQRRISELEQLNIRYSDFARISLSSGVDSVGGGQRLLDLVNIFQPTEETRSFVSERLPAIRQELITLQNLERVHRDLSGVDFLRQRQVDIVNQQQQIIRVLRQRLDLQQQIADNPDVFTDVALNRGIETQQAQLQNLADAYDRIGESIDNLQRGQTDLDLRSQVERIPIDLAIRESIIDSLFGDLGAAETEAQIRNVSRSIERLNAVILDTQLNRLDLQANRALQIDDPVRRASELASIRLERINFELESNANAARAEELAQEQLERVRQERQQQQVTILQLRSEASQIRTEINRNLADSISSEINAEIRTIQSTIQYNDTIIEQKSNQIERLNRQIESELQLQQSLIGFDTVLRGGEGLQRILDDIDRVSESQRNLARQQFAPDSAELIQALNEIENQRERARNREIELDRQTVNTLNRSRSDALLAQSQRFIQSSSELTVIHRNAARSRTEIDAQESRERIAILQDETLSENQRQEQLTRIRINAENRRLGITQLVSRNITRVYRQSAIESETVLTGSANRIAANISNVFDAIIPSIVSDVRRLRSQIESEIDLVFTPLENLFAGVGRIPFELIGARFQGEREVESVEREASRRIADIRRDETQSVRQQQEAIREIYLETQRQRIDIARDTERTLQDSLRRTTLAFVEQLQQQLIAFAAAETRRQAIQFASTRLPSVFGTTRSAGTDIGGSLALSLLLTLATQFAAGGFHNPINDAIARRAGVTEGLRQIARGDGSFGRQSAQDQVSHYSAGFQSALDTQVGAGNPSMAEVTLNVDGTQFAKVVAPILIREQRNGTIPNLS